MGLLFFVENLVKEKKILFSYSSNQMWFYNFKNPFLFLINILKNSKLQK